MIKRKQELDFASNIKNIYQVEKFIEEISDLYHINNTYFGNLLLAITEAVTNAIVHGNANDNSKKVRVEFNSDKKGLCFKVIDEGDGFDYMNVPNPLNGLNEEEYNVGRGIFLIKSLADEVNFNESGNEIELIFKISSINQETSLDRVEKLKQYNKAVGTKAKNSVE